MTSPALPPTGGTMGQGSGGSYNPNPGSAAPVTVLAINDIGNFSATSTPFQQPISLSGSGLQSLSQISWACTMPDGTACTGSPYVWTPNNWGQKFSIASDSQATATPVLLASGDPPGTYRWNATFASPSGTITKPFTVAYSSNGTGASLQIFGFSDYAAPSEPFTPTIHLTGQGFNAITQISWACTMPDGSVCSGSPYVWTPTNSTGKFAVSSDSSATASPTLLAQGDPQGLYHWTATFYAGSQQTAVPFLVNYSTCTQCLVPTTAEAVSALNEIIEIASACGQDNCTKGFANVGGELTLEKALEALRIVPPASSESKIYQVAVNGGILVLTVAGAAAVGTVAAVPIEIAGTVVVVTELTFRPWSAQ